MSSDIVKSTRAPFSPPYENFWPKMPNIELNDSSQRLLSSTQEVGQSAKTRSQRFWNGFKDFALQDNVLEVAVGLM